MHTLSAIELRKKFVSGELSATQIAQFYLDRIAKYDKELGAFLSVLSDRTLSKAKALDEKRSKGQKLGKLAAVPIAVKDNIHIKGEISTCASKFLTNYRAPFDSTACRLLEEQDALLIGKTNMDEFAMGSSTENSALQRTKNPWDLNCIPGGSSGGSSVAVAARMAPLSLGSDTGGSIRQPAALCGIVGFKPTYGRVSRYGLVAFGSSLDQIGPFSTCVADSALAMEVMGQHCERDSTSLALPAEELVGHLDGNVKGMKIGVPWQFLEDLADEQKKIFLHSLEVYKSLGAQIVDVDLSILKASLPVYYILATAEASTNLARFDGIRYGVRAPHARTLDEVYEFSKEEGFGPEVKRRILLGTFVLSAGYQDAYYHKAQKVRTLMIRSFDEAFKKCAIVAIPTTPQPAFEIGSIKDPIQMYLEDIYTIGSNLAGLPTISIPNGFTQTGKPLGLQLLGPQKMDLRVFQAAEAFERVTDYHKAVPDLSKF